MRVLILGFGSLARDIISKIKHFPEYGFDKGIYIYHVQTKRNTLSYPRELVVEIPDPHGDGYRTYKDGLQALDNYSTTVSNYVPWLLDEAKNGSFHVIIDCTPGDEESDQMIETLKAESKNNLYVFSPNKTKDVDATINELRKLIDGGAPWEPVEFSDELLKQASDAWDAAQIKMKKFHAINREKNIARHGNPGSMSKSSYSAISLIQEEDRWLVDRFIVKEDPKGGSSRHETYDEVHDCIVVEHDMLTYFFGWLPGEYIAATQFLDPHIEIESAKYVKYLSDTSTHIDTSAHEYVIEHVHRGVMDVDSFDGSNKYRFDGAEMMNAFAYKPKFNSPKNIKVKKNLETLVFTYRKIDL